MTLHVDRLWHDEQTTVWSVANWAAEVGELNTVDEVLYFFEKPWKYEELYEQYQESIVSELEAAELRRATL